MPRPNTGPRLKWVEKRSRYYIQFYEQGQQRLRSTGTADPTEAEDKLAEYIGKRRLAQRPDGPRDPSQLSIDDVLTFYWQEHVEASDDAEKIVADPVRIGFAIDALLPFWTGKKVAAITKESCKQYARQRKRAPSTIRRELGTLRAALNHCVEAKYLTTAPAVEMPPKPDGKDRWLTHREAARLLWAAKSGRADVRLYLPLFILIGLYTGARKEAILSLKWPQVNLETRKIDFRRPGARRTTKGRAAHQPIPDRLFLFLRLAWERRSSDIGPVIHDKGEPILDIGDSKSGSFGRACARAGLTDVSPHTLRHTCGTWMAQSGTDLWKIAGWLGQSYATTTELYAHHHPDHMEEAKRAADRRK